MKKNIIIIILIVIIIILLIKIMNPSVVTQRKVSDLNRNTTQEISDDTNKMEKEEGLTNNTNNSPLVPEFRIQEDSANTVSLLPQTMEIKPQREYDIEEPILYKKQTNPPKNSSYTITVHKTSLLPEECDLCSRKKSNSAEIKYNPLKEYNAERNNYHPINHSNNTSSANSLNKSLYMCAPYKESSTSEYLGMNMKYTLEILGWQNGKCVLNFESNIAGTGSSFEEMYGVPVESAQIFGFAPKIRCEFTKQQLLYVGDNILEEKNQNRKMLKEPNQINFPDIDNLSLNDIKLLQVIFNDKACKVLNTNDFSKMIEDLFNF